MGFGDFFRQKTRSCAKSMYRFLVLFILIYTPYLKAQCTPDEMQVVRHAISEQEAAPNAQVSFTIKWLQRMGDAAAVCLVEGYPLDNIKNRDMLPISISILEDAFSDTKLIEKKEYQSPHVSLLLVRYLISTGSLTQPQRDSLEKLNRSFSADSKSFEMSSSNK